MKTPKPITPITEANLLEIADLPRVVAKFTEVLEKWHLLAARREGDHPLGRSGGPGLRALAAVVGQRRGRAPHVRHGPPAEGLDGLQPVPGGERLRRSRTSSPVLSSGGRDAGHDLPSPCLNRTHDVRDSYSFEFPPTNPQLMAMPFEAMHGRRRGSPLDGKECHHPTGLRSRPSCCDWWEASQNCSPSSPSSYRTAIPPTDTDRSIDGQWEVYPSEKDSHASFAGYCNYPGIPCLAPGGKTSGQDR